MIACPGRCVKDKGPCGIRYDRICQDRPCRLGLDEGPSMVIEGADIVYAFATYSSVKVFDSQKDYVNNMRIIRNILDAIVRLKVQSIVFSSSSIVCVKVILGYRPYRPPFPIMGHRRYGRSGNTSYAHMNATILRFSNVASPNSPQGVIDFISNLVMDDKELEILADGRQIKQYIHVDDVVE